MLKKGCHQQYILKSEKFTDMSKHEKRVIINKAVDETLSSGDWDDEDSDYNTPKRVDNKVAAAYETYVVE